MDPTISLTDILEPNIFIRADHLQVGDMILNPENENDYMLVCRIIQREEDGRKFFTMHCVNRKRNKVYMTDIPPHLLFGSWQ